MNQPQSFIVSAQLLNNIASYLASKPWIEVNELLLGLQAVEPVPEHVPDNGES